MEKTIQILKIKEKLSKLALSADWKAIDFFLEQLEFQIIIEELFKEHNLGYKFTPRISEAFNGILKCPPNNVKVLFIGQDPYPQQGVADGIAFSCSKTMKEQPSLRYIFDELEKLYSKGYNRNPNLERWSQQGIIMLNTTLTCRVNEIGSHYDLWKNFTAFFLEYMNRQYKDCITVLMGKKAAEWESYIPNHDIIKVMHPAAAAYTRGKWESNNLFEKINNKLKTLEKSEIIW